MIHEIGLSMSPHHKNCVQKLALFFQKKAVFSGFFQKKVHFLDFSTPSKIRLFQNDCFSLFPEKSTDFIQKILLYLNHS
jgi:hypothetical protein